MRTFEPPRQQRGFTYLLLLFTLALGGVALASLGPRWQVALQREREAELLFRGGEIRRAIESYRDLVVSSGSALPESLEVLVEDRRQGDPRYHLRRLYLDPFTGAADWLTVRDPDGRIIAVRSRSRVPALAQHELPVPVAAAVAEGPEGPAEPVRVGDWLFAASGTSASP